VTAFHALGVDWQGQRIAVAALDESAAGSLAFARVREVVEARLAAVGFVVLPTPDDADRIARLRAEIDQGRDLRVTRQVPIFGFEPYLGVGLHCVGEDDDRRCWAPPRYGVIGYETRIETRREYSATLRLEIVEAGAGGRPVYEGSAVARTTCASLAAVLEPMADALFEDWPGANGAVRISRVRLDLDC
jgi:hypothetical protein